jgi:adenylate cyclase
MVELVQATHATTARWRIRIGSQGGPVVAGVIGTRRFAHDVWGDRVDVAARLEAASEPDRIHVSTALASRLEDRFVFASRGRIELKGKGLVETCFLRGRR